MLDEEAMANFHWAIHGVAGFRLPRDIEDRFSQISSAATAELVIDHLKRLVPVEEGVRDWLQLFRISATWDVQHGLAASAYHFWRASTIESEIARVGLEMLPRLGLPINAGGCGGNTNMLDFEYQAFAFSLRRTLEYLAVAVGAYFKCDAHSIRDLTRTIRSKAPLQRSAQVSTLIDDGLENLRDVLPLEATAPKSVRDRLAHWTAVGAGVLHYYHKSDGYEISVLGGGDDQFPWRNDTGVRVRREDVNGTGVLLVSPVLEDQLNRVLNFVFTVLDDLVPPTPLSPFVEAYE